MRLHYDGDWTDGLRVVERLLITGERPREDLDRATAESAIEALELLDLPWIFGEIVDGGEALAEQVHNEATRGLQEVVQNAQDQRATHIKFGWRKRGRRAELLIAHNGDPVELYDVVSMAFPLVSGSRRDPEKIGRFGIGLKTLNQFGDRLEVHCPPLPGFEIQGGRIRRVPDAKAVRGFWDPVARETLFVLRLKDARFDRAFFRQWIDQWDASSLIFLPRLHSVSLVNLRSGRSLVAHTLTETKRLRTNLAITRAKEAELLELRDVSSSRRWTVYRVRYPVPKEMKRLNKALGGTVELAVATCNRADQRRLYTGLPLEEPCSLPFSLQAPFDINFDRTALLDTPFNVWLLERLAELVAAAGEDAFRRRARDGWKWVPLPGEHAGESRSRLSAQTETLARSSRNRLSARVRLRTANGETTSLGDLLIEAPELEGLLSAEDLERIDQDGRIPWQKQRPVKHALPARSRDSGRWREVLAAIPGTQTISVRQALAVLNWPDEEIAERGTSWVVNLMSAAIASDESSGLLECECLFFEGSSVRRSPEEVLAGARMPVMSLPEAGLAAMLGLAQKVDTAFRARGDAAKRVRGWLFELGALHEKATDSATIEALANGSGQEPLDLSSSPEQVRALRDSFERLSVETRDRLGPGIGQNILLAGFEFDKGEPCETIRVRPCDAYIPYRIEKVEGWPTAAGKAPGLRWLNEGYGELLTTRRDTASAVKRQGALAFLRSIGAAVAPRLHPGIEPDPNPHAQLPRDELTAYQLEQLDSFPKARTIRDDFDSQDLAAVLASITAKKTTVEERRKRARALFVCLARAWGQQYSGRDVATAAHHYGRWYDDGEISATWIGRLASEPWLSTRERKFVPAAPSELAILTDASFEIEGTRPERFAYELSADDLDSPLVSTIGIEGKPTMHTIVERLRALREGEQSGEDVQQAWVQQCYRGLASYCPGGIYESDADMERTALRAALGTAATKPGLIRTSGRWRSIPDVRRGANVGTRIPWVDQPDTLWAHVGVPEVSELDCLQVLKELSDRNETDVGAEILVSRRLIEIVSKSRKVDSQLKQAPLRTYQGWSAQRPIYAIRDSALADSVGEHWPVWRSPVPLDEAAGLVTALGLTLLEDASFSPDVPSTAVAGSELQAEFPSIIGHLKNYLLIHDEATHNRISGPEWDDLLEAGVALGMKWGVRIKAPGRRTLRVTPPAYLFRGPPVFCALDEDEAGNRDAGGRAIASYFLAESADERARAFLTLAWESAFRRRGEESEIIVVESQETKADENQPMPGWLRARQAGRKGRKPKAQVRQKRRKEHSRELVDVTTVDISRLKATVVTDGRRGVLRAPEARPVAQPSLRANSKARTSGAAGNALWSPIEREDAGYALMEAVLGGASGLDLDDVRSQGDVGADAVDHERDIWVELKTHGRDCPDTVRLEKSQARRAKEKGDRYWLVVVWNLEKPREPELLVVHDPLARLDTYIAAGIKLAGLNEIVTPRANNSSGPKLEAGLG